MTVLNVTMDAKTLWPASAIVSAITVITTPTAKVAVQATRSVSDSPFRRGNSVGKMSREMIEACRFSTPDRLDIVALNIAASMIPTRPLGSSVSAASAYEDSCGLARPGQIALRSGYSTRIASGGTNQMKAPTRNSEKHSSAIFRAARSSSTLK